MNTIDQTPMTSLFDDLSELWLKIHIEDTAPFQWIYIVDDAWFHPEDWELSIPMKVKDSNGEETTQSTLCKPVFSSCEAKQILKLPLAAENKDQVVATLFSDEGGGRDKDTFKKFGASGFSVGKFIG
jgi:hypothetical protein